MLPVPKRRRVLPVLVLIGVGFFVFRAPAQAAAAATSAMHGIGSMVDALTTFATNLG